MNAQELQELGMDKSRLAAKTAQMEALVNGGTPTTQSITANNLKEQLKASIALVDAKPPRKRRSDAGKPKPKPAAIAQQPGLLSAMQVLRLRDLIDTRETRRIELETAKDHLANREGALDAADNELDDFLNELQGKGK